MAGHPSAPWTHGPYFVGIALRARGKAAEARSPFDAALALAAGYIEPLTQLVQMDLADKKPDEAVKRVKEQIAQAPKAEAGPQYLLGSVYQAQNDAKPAEAAYKQAIELNPEISGVYLALGQLYATGGKEQEALPQFQDALKVNPKGVSQNSQRSSCGIEGRMVRPCRSWFDTSPRTTERFGTRILR